MSDDRRVHARNLIGLEVVRYDRAGKWFIEKEGCPRVATTVKVAARLAVESRATIFTGVPGGRAFDARVVKLRGAA